MDVAWLARFCRPDGSALDEIRRLMAENDRLVAEAMAMRARLETFEKDGSHKLRAAPTVPERFTHRLFASGPISDRLDI